MKFLEDVTDKQREAITHIDGPLLIVAGAGSGKTRVITRRIGYLMSEGISPYNILAITFTNKAANEMAERVKKFSSHKGMWVSTFHKMCSRILRKDIELLGYSKDFTIYDTVDQLNRIKSIMADLEIDTAHWKPRSIISSISNAKNKLIDHERFAATASDVYHQMVAKIYKKYDTMLKSGNALDFDDLLIKTVELLKIRPDVLSSYQERFKYILIDEYQDTNFVQYAISRLLAQKYKNICVTGDPDQSIYGWRGADLRNIMDFEKDYPDARVVLLEQNYRSTKNILLAASSVIQKNKYRKQKEIWTENEHGEKIKTIHCENEHSEAEEIAKTIRALRGNGIKYTEIALFYRTNAQSRTLEIALRNAGIPYVIVGGVEFYRRKEIKDILAYIRLCVNPCDDSALERAINTPARGIGTTTVKKIKEWAESRESTLFNAIGIVDAIHEVTGKSAAAIKRFYELIMVLRHMPETSVEKTLKSIIDKTGYIHFLRKSEEKESEDRIANVEELVNAAHEYDANHTDGSLQGFLEEVALISDLDTVEDLAEAVTLMTLHTAKGLEFPVVFISGMEEGLLPHSESRISEEEIEEERRLCYVGITRAMKRLFLTYTKRRMRYGQLIPCVASRFLDEIHADCMDRLDKTENHFSYEYQGKSNSWENDAVEACDVLSESDVFLSGNVRTFLNGEVVRHPVFGIGRVLEMQGSNEKASVKVSFNIGGTKNLMLAYAKLEKVT